MSDKQDAYRLIKAGFKQKEVARLLGRSENIISTWAKKENWRDKITEDNLFQETSEEKVRKLISFQLKVIEKIAEKREATLSETNDIEELQNLLISPGNIDALQKLFTTIKSKEIEWAQMVKIVRDLTEYVEVHNQDLARELSVIANDFLNERRKEQ